MAETPTLPDMPLWTRLWFALDGVLFLFPPIYWATNAARSNRLGLPLNLLYFVLGCTCIASSVVAAYICDPSRRGRGR